MAKLRVHGEIVSRVWVNDNRPHACKRIRELRLMSDGVVLEKRTSGEWRKCWRFDRKSWRNDLSKCENEFQALEVLDHIARCRAFETPSAAALRRREKEKARKAEIVARPKKVPSTKFEVALSEVAKMVKEACEKSRFGFIPNSYLYLALKLELGSYYAFLEKLKEWDPCVVVTSETIKYLGVGGN